MKIKHTWAQTTYHVVWAHHYSVAGLRWPLLVIVGHRGPALACVGCRWPSLAVVVNS